MLKSTGFRRLFDGKTEIYDKYYIRIKDDYIEDEIINGFYNQLQLVHQTRRLDYLLINMQGLHKKLEGTIQGGRLAEAILIMQRKRNKFGENDAVM